MLKKVLTWLAVAFVVFYVIQRPERRGRDRAAVPARPWVTQRVAVRLRGLAGLSPAVSARLPGAPRWGKDAEKYLLSDEPPVIATRRHPAVLVRPFARGVPGAAGRRLGAAAGPGQPGQGPSSGCSSSSARWVTWRCTSPSGGCGTCWSPAVGCC